MENLQVLSGDSIEIINRAEIDMQIETAKKYPRDLKSVLNKIEAMATIDTETAEDCFYALQRSKGDDSKTIEGLSVRFAEIIANAWGNIRVATRILGNDGKNITAQGACHDLENNVAISVTVDRRITNKEGRTYSDDMIVVTGNAASAIAFRNAVLKVIPRAITKKIVENVKQVALGQAMDLENRRENCILNFSKVNVKPQQLCDYVGVKSVNEIDKEKLFILHGLWNAIKEGSTTVYEAFKLKGIQDNEIVIAQKEISELLKNCTDETLKKQAIDAITTAESKEKLTIEILSTWKTKLQEKQPKKEQKRNGNKYQQPEQKK